MSSTILVTGARGYLGGRLVQGLAANGEFQILGTSRKDAAPPAGWPRNASLLRFDPVEQDETSLSTALMGVETVVHLAAPNEIESAANPAASLMSGGVGSVKLLRAAIGAGCKRFIFLSTVHVYGAPLPARIDEKTPANPSHPYAIIHRAAEDFVRAAHAKGEIDGVVMRLSNGIGAPAWSDIDRWTLIGNALCREAVHEGRVTLHGTGLQWRDFIVLGDFVRAVRLLATLPASALGDGIFNVGGRLPLRMVDVAKLIASRAEALFGCPIKFESAKPRPDETYPQIEYNIDKIAAMGFVPSSRASLEAEIDATLRLCRAAFGSEHP